MKTLIAVFCGLLFLTSCATKPVPVKPVPYVPPGPPLPWLTNFQSQASRPAVSTTNAAVQRSNPMQLAQLQIPPPPHSNQWIVLTLPNVSSRYTFYQRDSLASGTTWLLATNTSTNVILFLINKTIQSRFFKAIAANVGAMKVTLAWNQSTDPTVVGYNIYYGGASGNYTNTLSAGNATNLTVGGLVPGCTYYFAATTYNSSGVQSPFSNEVFYSVPTNSTPLPIKTARFPLAPTVVSVAATNVTSTNATVGGKVINTGGDLPVTMFFYGTVDPITDTNDDAVWQFIAVTGTSTNTVSTKLTGLTPNTTYYYLFAALNAAGMSLGGDLSFTTKATLVMSPKGRAMLPTGKTMQRPVKIPASAPLKLPARIDGPPGAFSVLAAPTGLHVAILP